MRNLKDREEELEELKDKFEEKGEKVSGQVRGHRKDFMVPLVIAVILSAAMFISSSIDQGTEKGPVIEGEIVNITVSEDGAEPFRPEISERDGVRFINNAEHELNFTFDRNIESFVIEPGESKVVDVNSIVYFYADAEEAEFREVKGGVNVQ